MVIGTISKGRIKAENPDVKVYDWIQGVPRRGNEDPTGCTRVWFPPEPDEIVTDGGGIRRVINPGTYVAVYDPVGIDKDKKELTDKHSHNAMFVFEMPRVKNGFKPRLCAARFGRPDRLEQADEDFYKLEGFSDRQLKKMAGNSIVVSVLQAIFKRIYIRTEMYGV